MPQIPSVTRPHVHEISGQQSPLPLFLAMLARSFPSEHSTNTPTRTSLGLDLGVIQRSGTRYGLFGPAAWALSMANQ